MSSFTFRGGPVLMLDQKGRLTVPARYKDLLMAAADGKMVVAKNPDGCLSLYPQPVWERFEASLRELPQSMNAWRRLFVGSATELEIDSASRVLIPPELRQWAGFDKAVMFMGVGAYFELWDTTRHAEHEQKLLAGERPEAIGAMVIE